MLNRRSFITISVAGAGVAAAGVITPALTAAADESTSTGNTQIQIGPVAVLAGTTILQVAAKKADFDFFTSSGAFSKSSNGLLVPSGIRLLSQERGVALPPISEQPEVKPKAETAFCCAYAVFDGLEGTNPVEVRIPGYTLVTGVPVVSLDNAPFVVNNNT